VQQNMGALCSSTTSVNVNVEELQTLANDKECRFDARELRDLMHKWLREHPSGFASKDEVVLFFSGTRSEGNKNHAGVLAESDKELLERTVGALDENQDGKIDFREAIIGLSILLRGGHDEKVSFLFHALDTDHSNTLSKAELRDALKAQIRTLQGREHGAATSTPLPWVRPSPTEQATEAVEAIFASGDLDGDGVLSCEEFLKLVESSPSLRGHFALSDAVRDFNTPNTSIKKRRESIRLLAAALDLLTSPTLDSPVPDGAAFDSSAVDPGLASSSAAVLEPGVVATVLNQVPGLSPVAIGEFLGSNDATMNACLHTFFTFLELQEMTLDQALRAMTGKLCLPREAQQIDRIVQAFAEAYCTANPASVLDEQSAYLIAFATVMLNSDAHTPTVKKKMTKSEFVHNCRLATPSVQADFLEGIYARVTLREITLGVAKDSKSVVESLLSATGRSELLTMLGSLNDTRSKEI
jgi:Ca2+-binding EF-hand superfamily protein